MPEIDELGKLGEAAFFSVAGLAKLLGMSPRTLRRRFVDRFGAPPRQWLDALRINRIAGGLRRGEPLKQLASDNHLVDSSHLYHFLMAHTHLTPRAFATHLTASYSDSLGAWLAD